MDQILISGQTFLCQVNLVSILSNRSFFCEAGKTDYTQLDKDDRSEETLIHINNAALKIVYI